MTMMLASHSRKEQPECPPANIQTLPEELLIEIFSYLSLGELCNTVSKVCTQWERLHWDPQLYSMPGILEDKGTIEDLFKCLDEEPHLASPHFDQVYIKEIIGKCLSTRYQVKRRTGELKDLIMILSHLTEVNVIGRIGSATFDYEELGLASFLRCCVQIEELKAENNICSWNEELIPLCEQLCGTLRLLHLNCCRWNLEGARALTKCRHLEDLEISVGPKFTQECLPEIANISSLRRLSIVDVYFLTEQTWISMFSNKALTGLTHLHLTNFRCNGKVAVAIATNLINLTDLFIFSYLPPCVVGNGLISVTKGCNKLTSLEFRCCGCQATESDILMIPKHLPRLKKLVLSHLRFFLPIGSLHSKKRCPTSLLNEFDFREDQTSGRNKKCEVQV